MVELELLQGRKGAVAVLRELEPAPLELVGLAETVFGRREPGPAQEGQRHDEDGDDRE